MVSRFLENSVSDNLGLGRFSCNPFASMSVHLQLFFIHFGTLQDFLFKSSSLINYFLVGLKPMTCLSSGFIFFI